MKIKYWGELEIMGFYDTVVIIENSSSNLDFIGWLLTFVSVIVAIIIFYKNERNKEIRHIKNQKELLKNILLEINFLTKKEMKLEAMTFGGHIKYFKDALEKKGRPHHDIRLLTEHHNLDYSIQGRATLGIRQLIFHANDKIRLLNAYRTEKLDGKKYFFTETKYKDYISAVIGELEEILSKIEEIIKQKFSVFI